MVKVKMGQLPDDTGGRRVTRPVGTRYEPKYTTQEFKKLENIMF